MKHDDFLEAPYVAQGQREAHAEAALEAARLTLTTEWLHDATSFGILLQYPVAVLNRTERWLRERAQERIEELLPTVGALQARQAALAAALQDLDGKSFAALVAEEVS